MKKNLPWFLLGLFLFCATLELTAQVLSIIGYSRGGGGLLPGLISTEQELRTDAQLNTRRAQVSRRVVAWLKSHPEVQKKLDVDVSLRNEPSRYSNVGVRNKQRFWGPYNRMTPLLDDDFEVFGQDSGKLKYRVNYQANESGFRLTGHEDLQGSRANVIFIGCSYTFGDGIPASETFPAKFAQRMKDVRVYNFGAPGSSPTHQLFMLSSTDDVFLGIDPDLPTVVVYVFIDDHIRRVVGTSEFFRREDRNYAQPEYALGDGKLVFRQNFGENFWNLRWLLYGYSRTAFSRVTRLELPPIGDDHLELIAMMTKEMENRIRVKLPSLHGFYFTSFLNENEYLPKLKPHLERRGIRVLDYTGINFLNLLGDHFHHVHDYHPSAMTYDLFETLLESDLSETLKRI